MKFVNDKHVCNRRIICPHSYSSKSSGAEKLNNFYAKDEITVELSDFEELVNNLTILNQKEKFIFYFQHLDERLRIKFEKQITGNISVNGILKDIQYLNALNFTFEMSTLEISELIRESKDLIDVLL